MRLHWLMGVCLIALISSALGAAAQSSSADFTKAVVVTAANLPIQQAKALDMLLDEAEKRVSHRWLAQESWPADAQAIIALGTAEQVSGLKPELAAAVQKAQLKPEGYSIQMVSGAQPPTLLVAGADNRGVLFGVGRLLREMRLSRDSVTVPAEISITTAPVCPLRGHQLGFRPKVNTYDGWTVPMWEQYYRDLIIFGTNAVELMPPRTDDAADSPHFPLPQIEMMAEMSRLADEYDLELWIWYPALDRDYGDPAQVEFALKEWGDVFAKLPRIDAVFVPGGDPGHTEPKYMMALLEKQTENLHKTHPNAEMWMSPQGFTEEWTDQFIEIMKTQPKWLSGIVFGPQNRMSLPELRKAIPEQYPIRHYPDITHSYSCQYPVQDWDVAYMLTLDRECVNPRPMAFAEIFRWALPYSNQFLTYSEGCNDDVNKMLWSGLGWEPEADVHQILKEYARYFIGPEFENSFSDALFALERNWQGPLIANKSVETTLQQVQDMEKAASPQLLLNWRFQQVVYRANYDAYVRQRLIHETGLEGRAMDLLRGASKYGVNLALDQAEEELDKTLLELVAQDLRERASDMAEALYQSIRMQLSVPKYRAISVGRGAQFDLIDRPVNNYYWLKAQFEDIRWMPEEREKLAAVEGLLNWCNPGPGGFYDDLGDPLNQPHLVRDLTKDFDPENRTNPLLGYSGRPDRRISWFVDAETRFEAPLKMQYDHLDPEAQYVVRVVYAGDKFDTQMRLLADDKLEVHGFMDKPQPIAPVEFDVPQEATADGALTLTWYQTPGRGSAGRGCQVGEVWLMKKAAEQ